MAPTFTFPDSFPHQEGRVQYVPPTLEAMPSQMMVDPSKVPTFHGTGPYGAHYSYPVRGHSCCNHMPFPGHYSYGRSLPHFHPPQPSPWWGSYPAYPHAMPVHYSPPPPPAYVAGIPGYEYDKYVAGPGDHHCCGCFNHVCKPQSKPRVKIEEQEPSIVKKDPSEGYVQSLVPSDFKNFPYPLIWVPPEYMKNLEHKKPSKLKSVDQKTEDKREQFSYPIFWIPYANQEVERDQKNGYAKSSSQVLPSDAYGHLGRRRESAPEGDTTGKGETPLAKKDPEEHLPVKNLEPSVGNVHLENAGKWCADVSDKRVENKVKGSSRKKEPVSPSGKPKLPPVCLRVDPLPMQKNNDGNSRSPSPPGARGTAPSGAKDDKGGDAPAEAANEKKPNMEKRKEVKVIKVKDSPTDKKDSELQDEKRAQHPVTFDSTGQTDRNYREASGQGIEEHETVDDSRENIAGEGKTEERKEKAVRPLSGTEAATLIQAAYRGFEVRKWETRKKLKQMARIRNEIAEIKKSIQELQSSYDSLDQEKAGKQKMVIGESIMSLLLSLDTIQGLHPSFRYVRKSLARELVALQEWLDSLVSRRSDEPADKQSCAIPEEDMYKDFAHVESKQCEESRDEGSQHGEAITARDESSAAQKVVELLEVEHPNAEASPSLLSVMESSSRVVTADLNSQESVVGNVQCREVEADKSIEQVSQLKSSEDGECEAAENKKDEVSSVGPLKFDAMAKQTSFSDSGDLISRDTLSDGGLLVEPPTGVSADDQEQEIVECHPKSNAAYESNQQQEPLNEQIKDINSVGDAGVNQLDMAENEQLSGPFVNGKQDIAINGGDVVAVTPHEEGTLAVPAEEILAPEEVKDESALPDRVNGKEGHSQELHDDDVVEVPVTLFGVEEFTLPREDATALEQWKDKTAASDALSGIEQHDEDGTVVLVTVPEEVESTLLRRETTTPERVKDEPVCSVISTEEPPIQEENLGEKIDGNACDQSIEQENEMEKKHQHSDRHEPEIGATEQAMKNANVTEPPEKEVVVVSEDHPASHAVALPSKASKPSNGDEVDELANNGKALEDNEKLRAMMQKLMEAGKEQFDVISSLTGRVKDLEKKLAKSRRMRSRRCRMTARPSRLKASANSAPGTPLPT